MTQKNCGGESILDTIKEPTDTQRAQAAKWGTKWAARQPDRTVALIEACTALDLAAVTT